MSDDTEWLEIYLATAMAKVDAIESAEDRISVEEYLQRAHSVMSDDKESLYRYCDTDTDL
jgi:hypothetical protein